jgi:hypothetical protein
MKHLLSAIAVAALMSSVPAWAQISASDPSQQPMPQASSSGKADSSAMDTGTSMRKTHHKAAMRGGRAPQDNMAEELNQQELDRVTHNGGEASGSGMQPNGVSGTSGGMSGTTAAPSGTSNGSLPSSGAPQGYQPNNAGSRAGGAEIGQPSPGTLEEHPGASSKQ